MFLVQPEHPRARRYPFVATIELTDVQSETQTSAQTSDLSLFGCHVDMRNPLPTGTRVRLRIVHKGAKFVASGRVAFVLPSTGMGILFTQIEPDNQLILEKWIAELRDR